MGKRSINTTKSGKFMNPTDQARKEARRRELKKNKKQRQMVRTAVIKGKNPTDIIVELEKLDDMEFNVLVLPPLGEKVMKEKRRKLMETWTRVIHLYERENVEQYVELKKLWHNYLQRKKEVVEHFDAVKSAQNVEVEEIPLPMISNEDARPGDIPLPPALALQPKAGILKKSSVLDSLRPKTCPGVPSGPPPLLGEYVDPDDDDDDEDKGAAVADEEPGSGPGRRKIRFANEADDSDGGEESKGKEDAGDDTTVPGEEEEVAGGPKVDNLQRKMLAMAGQDVDAYMKEMEEVHKKSEAEKAADVRQRLARFSEGGAKNFAAGQPQFMPLRPGIPPPGVRMPPGPPPGPPPGRPMFMRPPMRPAMPRPQQPQSVLSAGPQLNPVSNPGPAKPAKTGGVIEAKPQMRNLLSDVTRFVPTNVKMKRDTQAQKKQTDPMRDVFAKHSQPQAPQKSKDDAYAQFMAEMEKMM